MERVDLKVPFSQKEAAKKLGAQWDISTKTWYVPEDLDPGPFKKWIKRPKGNETTYKCPRCNAPLIKRMNVWKAKYFFGCARYPKCRYRWG